MSHTIEILVSEVAYDEIILGHLKQCERCKTFVMVSEAVGGFDLSSDGITSRKFILCIECKEQKASDEYVSSRSASEILEDLSYLDAEHDAIDKVFPPTG